MKSLSTNESLNKGLKCHQIIVDGGRCVGCGMCVGDCVSSNITLDNGKARIISGDCIKCGHCVALCPKAAISVTGYDDEPVAIEQDASLDPEKVMAVIRNRRTIRQFRSEPVPQEVIYKIIEAGRLTHTGRNAQGLSFIVLDKEKEAAEKIAVSKFRSLIKLGTVFSSLLRRNEINDNFFFFNAPLVIIVAAKSKTDAVLAAQNMEFVAEAYGLGTLISGFFTIAASFIGKLRKLLGVPEGKKVQITLVMGYPKVKYRRSAQRESADVIYR